MIYYQKCANHTTYYTDCTACVLNTLNHIAEIQGAAAERARIVLLSLAQERDEMREHLADFESGKAVKDLTTERDYWVAAAGHTDAQLARTRAALSELLEQVVDGIVEGPYVEALEVVINARAALTNAKEPA